MATDLPRGKQLLATEAHSGEPSGEEVLNMSTVIL